MEKSGRVWLPFKSTSKFAALWRDPAYMVRASNKSGCVDFYREKNQRIALCRQYTCTTNPNRMRITIRPKWVLAHAQMIVNLINSYSLLPQVLRRLSHGKRRHLHIHPGPHRAKQNQIKPEQMLSCWCFVFEQRTSTYYSRFTQFAVRSNGEFHVYLPPEAIFRIFQTRSFDAGDFLLVDVECCYCCSCWWRKVRHIHLTPKVLWCSM